MKSKIYFAAMLACSLAACNSEEDLQNSESNQISPVTFVLDTTDGVASRAAWGGKYGYTLNWTEGDLLSLYHGGEEGEVDGLQNAIYKAKAGSSDGKLEFTTQSMIQAGQAIMVYPADTTFRYDGSQLFVTVPTVQTKTTNLNSIPFMSEGIKVAAYDATKNQGAGYGKEYPIKMKQVGNQITLKSNWTGTALKTIEGLYETEGIDELTITSVTLNRPTEKFNVAVPVALKDAEEGQSENWSSVVGLYNIDSWNKVSYADAISESVKQETALTSKDADLNSCEFQLLPQTATFETTVNSLLTGRASEDVTNEEKYGKAKDDASIVIMTYYGSVTLDKNSGQVMYLDDATEEDYMSVHAGLNFIVDNTQRLKTTGTFANEVVGSHGTVNMDVDLSTLDMSAVHIKSDKHLRDILCVYNAIGDKTEELKLTIDGNASRVFELSMSNVKTLQSAGYENVKLLPCQSAEESCTTISLIGGGEVPAIEFVAENNVTVTLGAGYNWTWSTKNTQGSNKSFGDKIEKLVNNGNLTVKASSVIADYTSSTVPVMENKGTINIYGEVKQMLNMTNVGIVNVNADAEYLNAAVFTNDAESLYNYGKVYNSGVFGNVGNEANVINNYGYIKQMTASSKTFITSNQTDGVSFANYWAENNKYGTIELFDKDDDNYSVSNAENEGFIMITTTATEVTSEEIGKEANYVKVAGSCTSIDYSIDPTKTRVRFVEIASDKEVVWTTAASKIRGLKVNADCKLYIKKDNKVEVSQGTYLKGKIYKGGDFTTASYKTYFHATNDAADDSANVIKWN